jgi:hypothetical protein
LYIPITKNADGSTPIILIESLSKIQCEEPFAWSENSIRRENICYLTNSSIEECCSAKQGPRALLSKRQKV